VLCKNCNKEFEKETDMCPNCGVSKNPIAEKICGFREKRIALFEPHELGYACPICDTSDEVNLRWSEYNYFIWCKKCNLDIPSCLCKKFTEPNIAHEELPIREKVIVQTRIFLKCLEDIVNSQQ